MVRFFGAGRKGTRSSAEWPRTDSIHARPWRSCSCARHWIRPGGITQLNHAGISGDFPGGHNDCHGQGRAIDFVHEVKCSTLRCTSPSSTIGGRIHVPGLTTTTGDWPLGSGSNPRYRLLADTAPDTVAWQFFLELCNFAATNHQDRTSAFEDTDNLTVIGKQSRFIMHPDHPTSAPGTPNGREAHKGHMHLQIGPTGPA